MFCFHPKVGKTLFVFFYFFQIYLYVFTICVFVNAAPQGSRNFPHLTFNPESFQYSPASSEAESIANFNPEFNRRIQSQPQPYFAQSGVYPRHLDKLIGQPENYQRPLTSSRKIPYSPAEEVSHVSYSSKGASYHWG